MSSLRLVQGARGLVGRIANNAVMTTSSSSSSYSTDKHHGKREYRRQGTDSRVATMASAAAVAAAAITYSYGGKEEEKVAGAEVQHKKKTVDKKPTLDEITRQEIIAEENRVRQHTNPDKVFNYFASYQVVDKKGNKNIMMSPLDFFHCITPGAILSHATGSGVYTEVREEELADVTSKLEQAPEHYDDSVLNAIGKKGLFSYADFYVLLTLLSTPKRYIDTAFQMFDVTGEGVICAKEFAYISTHMAFKMGGFGEYTHVDQKEILDSNSGLINYLFGTDRQGGITKAQFYKLQSDLLDEIIELQFAEYDPKLTGRISEVDFCKFLLQNAKLTSKKKKEMLRRVQKKWPTQGKGISLDSFKNMYHVLAAGADLERALFYLDVEGIGVDIEEYKKIASWVSQKEPSPHCAEVIFELLDDDGDGRLYHDTLHPVLLEWRHSRGFDKGSLSIVMGQLKV